MCILSNQDDRKVVENLISNTKKQIYSINIDNTTNNKKSDNDNNNNLDRPNKPVVSVIKSNGSFAKEKFRNSTTSNYFKK